MSFYFRLQFSLKSLGDLGQTRFHYVITYFYVVSSVGTPPFY